MTASGISLWNASIGKVFGTPAVANGYVYVGGAKTLYCFDADSGVEQWNYTAGNLIRSSPVVVEGKVYFGSRDDKIYAHYP